MHERATASTSCAALLCNRTCWESQPFPLVAHVTARPADSKHPAGICAGGFLLPVLQRGLGRHVRNGSREERLARVLDYTLARLTRDGFSDDVYIRLSIFTRLPAFSSDATTPTPDSKKTAKPAASLDRSSEGAFIYLFIFIYIYTPLRSVYSPAHVSA